MTDLLAVLTGEMSREELQEALDLSARNSFRDRYLKPSREAGLIEMTIPGRPISRLQRYRRVAQGTGHLEKRAWGWFSFRLARLAAPLSLPFDTRVCVL